LQRIIANNPFPDAAANDPSHLIVMFLKGPPTTEAVKTLQAAIKGSEVISADGRQLYMIYPDGMGQSKLTGTLIERKLATRGTARNWNTVIKLAALTQA
jgi:uncharacterized protein (DUF1697 family)